MLSYYLRDDVPAAGNADALAWCCRLRIRTGDWCGNWTRRRAAGLHRTAWDLRESAPQAAPAAPARAADAAPFSELLPGVASQEASAAGRGGPGRGGRGGRGAMVKPGTYTVTLGRVASGVLMPIGDPQTVEVVALEASNR